MRRTDRWTGGRPGAFPAARAVVAMVAAGALTLACGDVAPEPAAPADGPATAASEAGGVDAPEQPASPSSDRAVEPPAQVAADEPSNVRIPAIDVDSDLLHLGVADDGTAEVPEDFALPSWFDGGGRPNTAGPTVLLGHVDSRDGPAVFFRLRDLDPGDVIEVTLGDGSTAEYAVARTQQVPKDEFPTFEVFGGAPDDVLRLVTCTGEFDRGERSYLDNLVVHADRIA